MKREKYKINEIKEDIDEHAVTESEKNVSDRPQKQVQEAEMIDEEFVILIRFQASEWCSALGWPSASQVC